MEYISIQEKIKFIENSASLEQVQKSGILPDPDAQKGYYFVSYSHKDYKVVFKHVLRLLEQGINLWYDRGLEAGKSWREDVKRKIYSYNCKGVICFLSANCIGSESLLQEYDMIRRFNKPMVAVEMNSSIFDSVEDAFVVDGVVDENAFGCWFKQLSEASEQFPALPNGKTVSKDIESLLMAIAKIKRRGVVSEDCTVEELIKVLRALPPPRLFRYSKSNAEGVREDASVNRDKADETVNVSKETVKTKESELTAAEKAETAAKGYLDGAKAQLTSAKEAVSAAESALTAAQTAVPFSAAAVTAAQTALATAKAAEKAAEAEVKLAEAELEKATAEKEKAQAELDKAKAQLENDEEALKTAEGKLKDAEAKVAEAEKKVNDAKTNLQNARTELAQQKEAYEAVKDLERGGLDEDITAYLVYKNRIKLKELDISFNCPAAYCVPYEKENLHYYGGCRSDYHGFTVRVHSRARKRRIRRNARRDGSARRNRVYACKL